MIDFIIAVRDRDNKRIQRCINSIKKHAETITVVDYGSKKPVKVKNANIIKYNKSKIWNKSHALNLGIKATKSEYICTIDCDIILSEEIIEDIYKNLNHHNVIFNTNVNRIEIKDISKDYNKMIKKSKPWFTKNNYSNIYSRANGGIQIFSREWINLVGGYDEGLGIYWGAMDNRIYEQAKMTNQCVIDLNIPMLHQEHKKTKENNLDRDEREFAEKIRAFKIQYLQELINKGEWENKHTWGGKKPNHDWIIKLVKEWSKKLLPPAKIYIAIINNYSTIPTYFMLNLFRLVRDLKKYNINYSINNIHAAAVDSIRNYSIINALDNNHTHILQLDTDHIYPDDTIVRLLSHKKEFVCGVTTKKIPPFEQTQFYKVDVPKVNFPKNVCKFKEENKLEKIEGTGMVGSLIDLKIFSKLNFPYYDRKYKLGKKGEILETGEDIYFCRQLKKVGVDVWCDKGLSYPHQIFNTFSDRGNITLI